MKLVLIGVLLGFATVSFAQNKKGSSSEKLRPENLKKLVQQYDAIQSFKVVIQADLPRPLPPENPSQPPSSPPTSPPQSPPHPRPPPDCYPPDDGAASGACVEAVCSQLSYFECSTRDKLLDITRMCRNVRGTCVRAVCSRLGTFECDERRDLEEVTRICRGLYDTSCIDYVCSRLPRWDCDELNELRKIADQCR